jgi:hypothetical protein
MAVFTVYASSVQLVIAHKQRVLPIASHQQRSIYLLGNPSVSEPEVRAPHTAVQRLRSVNAPLSMTKRVSVQHRRLQRVPATHYVTGE